MDPAHLAAELMPEGKREERRAAAKAAEGQGLNAEMYRRKRPQLPTVGHLTTAAAGIGAGYAIGLLTGRLKPPAAFFSATSSLTASVTWPSRSHQSLAVPALK